MKEEQASKAVSKTFAGLDCPEEKCKTRGHLDGIALEAVGEREALCHISLQ